MSDLELSADDLKALDEMRREAPETPVEPAPSPAPASEEITAQPRTEAQPERQEQLRAPDGKFASKPEEKPAEQPRAETKEEQPDRRVPLAELIEERKARQELQRRLEETSQNQARLDERLKALQERIKPAEQPKPLDVDAQPLEALKQTRQQVDQLSQITQQQAIIQHVVDVGGASEREFMARQPDYNDAAQFLVSSRRNELAASGWPPVAIERQIQQEKIMLAAAALDQGVNVGERFYNIAKARGYAAKQPEPKPETKQQQQTPTAAQKLETIAKGKEAAQSLGGTGGAADTALTLERLVEMTPEQLAKLPEHEFRRIMGAR